MLKAADRLGMASAGLCVLHCLAIPALIIFLPYFRWLDTGEETHLYLAAFALLFALIGLIPGYFLHRQRSVLVWGIGGLSCLLGATLFVGPRYGEVAEVLMTVLGAFTLFITHVRNRKYCKSCPA